MVMEIRFMTATFVRTSTLAGGAEDTLSTASAGQAANARGVG
jgi:hypothetical protein